MTSLPLACAFQCLLHLPSFLLSADWQKSDSSVNRDPQGNWRWNSNSRDIVARSASFSCPTARAPWTACSQARVELVFILTVENQIMFNHMQSVFSSRHKNTVYACNTKSIHCNLLSGIISNAPILKRCL